MVKKPRGPWESVSDNSSKLESALSDAKEQIDSNIEKEHRVVWDQIEVDAAFMGSSIFLFIITEDYCVHRASQNALDYFGWSNENLRGHEICQVLRCVDLNTPEGKCSKRCIEGILESTFKSNIGVSSRSAKLFQTIGGEKVEKEFYISSVPLTIGQTTLALLSLSDVTDWKRIQTEANKAHSLKAIGRLAGGIAHDFNNILSVILGKTAMIQLCKKSAEPEKEQLERISLLVREIEASTLNAADLSNELLSCAQGGEPMKTVLNLDRVMNKARARSLHKFSTCLEFMAPGNLWPIEADATQMDLAIRNILVNSAEAMKGEGIIRVVAENLANNENTAELLPPGNYVHLTIFDEGRGVSPEDLKNVMEPYFSTKAGSRGLGLTLSYAIIKRHGGDLLISSHEGKGTAVHLYIPALTEAVVQTLSDVSAPTDIDPREKRRILIVDDNPCILEVVKEMVESLGWETSCVPEGKAALEAYKKSMDNGEAIDGVILDLSMPDGMDGRETMRGLMMLNADVRVVVSSGYNNDPIMAKFWEYGFCAVLPKPYSFGELKRALSRF